MIAKDKMRTMSRMAMFEKSKEGREAIKTIRFFRTDFVRWEILKTTVSVTIGYAIILALIILYNLEYLIKNATKLNYSGLGIKTLGIYIVVLIIYISYTVMSSVYKYRLNRRRFLKYERYLKELARIYDFEEFDQEESNDTVTGVEG